MLKSKKDESQRQEWNPCGQLHRVRALYQRNLCQ